MPNFRVPTSTIYRKQFKDEHFPRSNAIILTVARFPLHLATKKAGNEPCNYSLNCREISRETGEKGIYTFVVSPVSAESIALQGKASACLVIVGYGLCLSTTPDFEGTVIWQRVYLYNHAPNHQNKTTSSRGSYQYKHVVLPILEFPS